MTLFGSPIFAFHQTLNNVYIPTLLSHDIGREPQVQSTLKILDTQLKYALHQSGTFESLGEYNRQLLLNIIWQTNHYERIIWFLKIWAL